MAKPGSFKVPTHESEVKRAREEDAAEQRLNENGRSILTMWMIGHVIQHNRQDFQLSKESITIIATFSNFTNQTGSGLDLTEDEMQILRDFAEEIKREYFHNNVEVHEGFNCRDLWKSFLQAYWASDGFLRFEAKFAPKLVLPFFKRDDGATLVLSDNLFLLDKLTKFLKELSMLPTLTQRMSSFYASSGLTVIEKAKLLFSGRQEDHMKHQLKIASAKLTCANDALKEATERSDFLQPLLEREQVQSKDLLEQIASLQSELDAHKIALRKYLDARPAECIICQTLYTNKTSMKSTSCCGTIICDSCYEDLKRHTRQDNPRCPQCRNCTRQNDTLVRILDSHPTIRRLEVCDAETTTDPEVFLEAQIGGPEIEPIPKPTRPPSIYAKLLQDQLSAGGGAAGGGGAERPNPPYRRGPPAARGDA
jgi:hypothetical protein